MIDDATQEQKIAQLNDSYLRDCVRITPESMNEEFMQLPGVLAYWNQKYAEAHKLYLDSKLDVSVTRARLQPLVREALALAGGRVTEAQVEAAIDSNEDYIDAIRRMNAADSLKQEAWGIVDTMRAKREMLVSLGANIRVEMQNDPTIREYARSNRVRDL